MKKILFVVDEKRLGGVSIVLENILWAYEKSNHMIDVVVLHNQGECLQNIPSNVTVIPGTRFFDSVDYPISEIIKKKKWSLLFNKLRLVFLLKTGMIKKRIRKERRKMKLSDYDCEIAFKDGFTAIFTAYGNSHNKVHWLHYEYNLLNPNSKYPGLFQDAFKRFNHIIAVSKGVMDCFNHIYHLEKKTSVIANLINIDDIKNKAMMIPEVEKIDGIHFISVGRLHMQKGYDRLLRIIAKLKDNNRLPEHCHFKIYGDGPEAESLIALNHALGIDELVEFAGQTLNPFPFIQSSDMFILPSLYEPFGLVIVEAMTLGVPVLATANAATSELIQNNRNGLIVENSEEGLYQGLLRLLEKPSDIHEMKVALSQYHYDNNGIVESINKLFEGGYQS